MYIDTISFENFRCIESGEISFSSGVNLLSGGNAQGKTSVIEGIYMFAHGRSFRSAKDREIIRFGCDMAHSCLKFTDRRRKNEMEIALTSTGRRAFVKNGVSMRRLSEFVGCFRAVLFCPAHLSIVREGPAVRRTFVDMALTQLSPSFIRALQKYSDLLHQRNKLIKLWYDDRNAYESTIDIWSHELAVSANEVALMRYNYCEKLNKEVSFLISDMTGGKEKVCLKYTEPDSIEGYENKLTINRDREIKAGTTLYGAHRDDISITLNGNDARSYGSQGQQRSIALAMKLAEGEISKNETGEYPVFLFDDILSELDNSRRSFVLAGLEGRQVIITSCDFSHRAERIITVDGGKFFNTPDNFKNLT